MDVCTEVRLIDHFDWVLCKASSGLAECSASSPYRSSCGVRWRRRCYITGSLPIRLPPLGTLSFFPSPNLTPGPAHPFLSSISSFPLISNAGSHACQFTSCLSQCGHACYNVSHSVDSHVCRRCYVCHDVQRLLGQFRFNRNR